MPRSFLAYIDESGDEGFVFKSAPEKGSSDWFILSAVVVPANQDNIIRLAAADIRVALKMEPKATIHFSDLTHDKRVCAIEKISALPVKIVSVIINKHTIKKRALFQEGKHRLYYYSTRLLLERVSWYCRDSYRSFGLQNCEVKLIFEHRRRMSYEALREYIATLYKAASIDEFHQMLIHDIRIHWPSINILYLESAQKHDYAGLQLADCAAGGIRAALEKNHFGNTEHRYAKTIRPAVYSRRSKYSSYGMKFFPGPPDPADGCAHWINKHYK